MAAGDHQQARAERSHTAPSRGRVLASAAALAVAAVALYLLLPRIAGLRDSWDRLDQGDPAWLAAALVLEVASFASYVVLFRAVIARPPARLGWRESYLVTMAGLAATRLLAAGGAGGVALTAWAMRRSGVQPRMVASRLTTFMVLLYGVFMAALLVGGLGLRTGALPGPAPFALTVPPAVLGGGAIALALGFALVPARAGGDPARRSRSVRWMATAAAVVGDGVREAIGLLRRRDWRLAGAIGWWAFDVAVLWACLKAFGGSLAVAAVVVAYFVGMLGNLLPLPGGIGGVDGGMIGALIAFGVPAGLAVAAVLTYRAFAFWLPTLPGVVAYVQLLRTVSGWRRARPRP